MLQNIGTTFDQPGARKKSPDWSIWICAESYKKHPQICQEGTKKAILILHATPLLGKFTEDQWIRLAEDH